MSALGQKQTSESPQATSALPPITTEKADIAHGSLGPLRANSYKTHCNKGTRFAGKSFESGKSRRIAPAALMICNLPMI
jgi:hypothetical protein